MIYITFAKTWCATEQKLCNTNPTLMRNLIVIILLLAIYLCPAYGQKPAIHRVSTDTLHFEFPQGKIGVNLNFSKNRAVWATFQRQFQERFADKEASDITVDIFSGASPEGSVHLNNWLAESRGNAIRDFIRKQYGSRIGNIYVHNQATTWDDFYDVIAATHEPWRDEAQGYVLVRDTTLTELILHMKFESQFLLWYLLTWLLVAFLTRYSSLSALVSAALAPVYYGLMFRVDAFFYAICIISAGLIYRHRQNIINLVSGRESKIGSKKKAV